MWHNNKSIIRTHSKNGGQQCWAIVDGISGWKRVKPNTADGVANVFLILSAALANGRKADVFIDGSNQISQATLR